MVTIKKGTEHTEEFQPKPNQSRLLKYDSIYFRGYSLHISSDIKKHIFNDITQDQRDLTASIVRDEWRVKASDLVAARAEIAQRECQALIEALIEKQKADTVAAIGLAMSHIWQYAKGTGHPLMWEISDADRRSVLKHYGVHYQGDNCPTCEGKCKAKYAGR